MRRSCHLTSAVVPKGTSGWPRHTSRTTPSQPRDGTIGSVRIQVESERGDRTRPWTRLPRRHGFLRLQSKPSPYPLPPPLVLIWGFCEAGDPRWSPLASNCSDAFTSSPANPVVIGAAFFFPEPKDGGTLPCRFRCLPASHNPPGASGSV